MKAPRTIIISGAGFLGRALTAHLEQGRREVVVCDSPGRLARATPHSGETVDYEFGVDEPERIVCGPGDRVVVFGWRGYPGEHEKDPVGKLSLNLHHTLGLLRHVAACGVAQVVYASSGGAVYGNPETPLVTEAAPTHPTGFYGIGKLTAEMYVRKVMSETAAGHVVLRIGNAYGPGQLVDELSVGVVAKAVRAALTGEPLEVWGDGKVRRDFIHSGDIARAFEAVLETPGFPSGTYNLGSGLSLSVNEIVAAVSRTLGVPVPVRYEAGRAFDVAAICLDSSRLGTAAGWKPRVSLQDGILELAEVGRRLTVLRPSRPQR